jgi:hypothetical protein
VLDLLLVICGCLVLGDSFVHNICDLLDGDIGVCITYIKRAHSQNNWVLVPNLYEGSLLRGKYCCMKHTTHVHLEQVKFKNA